MRWSGSEPGSSPASGSMPATRQTRRRAMKLRKARRRRRGRIEIIPMIDVMFFLLATFMLASLALQNLHALAVDLPQGRARQLEAPKRVTLTVAGDGQLALDAVPVALDDL